MGISSDEAQLYERLASRVLYTDGSLRATPDALAGAHAGPAWALGARHLGRPAHPPRARGRGGRHPAGAPGAAGAGILAAEGAERGRRHPQRAPGELPRRDARAARRGPRHRTVGRLEAPARRRLPAARRPDDRGGAPPALQRGARHPERGPRAPSRPSSTGPTRSPCSRPSSPRPRCAPAHRAGRPGGRGARAHPPQRLGGFAAGGREYVVVLEGDAETPLPWVNVIANPGFGTVVSASGSAYTWAENSRENRLTPFANDPVSDPTGEALFLRDEDTGDIWCADAGADPPDAGGRPLRGAPRRRRLALRARRARHRAGAGGLRGRHGTRSSSRSSR